MRDFRPVVGIRPVVVNDTGHNGAVCGGIGPQLVGHQPPGLVFIDPVCQTLLNLTMPRPPKIFYTRWDTIANGFLPGRAFSTTIYDRYEISPKTFGPLPD